MLNSLRFSIMHWIEANPSLAFLLFCIMCFVTKLFYYDLHMIYNKSFVAPVLLCPLAQTNRRLKSKVISTYYHSFACQIYKNLDGKSKIVSVRMLCILLILYAKNNNYIYYVTDKNNRIQKDYLI